MNDRIRQLVRDRAGNRCEYCLCPASFSPGPFSVEHIIPKSKGGADALDNLAFACQGCNGRKYNHIFAEDPITGLQTRLFHPRSDQWNIHFEWDETQSVIIAISAIGRASVSKLQLNRTEVVNLRLLLHLNQL
ncbi:MAG TPA: HNH endonuclease signature motif containing protein [Saprospiraceae bacterium]|nr:HNH endonuclease signature motif containing protein [Saprospiraceae bacterium]